MRILIDTNILFSALLLPESRPARALLHAARNHESDFAQAPMYCRKVNASGFSVIAGL